ncbi:MAG: conjugal transfer protein TraF [Gammaproteobacteria bacterium]|nr:conjugal transfer protein TraF [Gammaproteobacteria bacterium]
MQLIIRFAVTSIFLFLALSGSSIAATFGTYDPRSLAMGGTGVSQANIDHAAYYNPALLSISQQDDDFSLLIPTIGARIYDPENFLEALEDHQDGKYETAMQDAVNQFENAVTPVDAQASALLIVANAQRLRDSFVALSDKELDFEIHAGIGLAIPSKSLGFAFIASGRAMSGVVVNISEADKVLMQDYIKAAQDFADNASFDDPHPANVVCGTSFCDAKSQLTSRARIQGAVIVESGISLSHEFSSLGDLSIGITPKSVNVSTYDYQDITVENSEIDKEKGKQEYDDTNLDIGFAKRLNGSWKIGGVIKNAIKKEYKTVLGNTITLEPAVRAGVSHHTNWTTVALDIDLTENKRLGLTGEKTRYAGLGMEFDLSIIQLRIGGRHNLSANDGRQANLLSAGLGVYLAGFHVDLGVAKNDDELAAALQLGLQF